MFVAVDKVDIAVQTSTNFEEDLREPENANVLENCKEVKEEDSEIILGCDVENNMNASVKRNICGISRAMDNYAACRLATPFMPSPMLDRRTIL